MTITETSDIAIHNVIHPNWPAAKAVQALSTTRLGGVSQGSYSSLNLGQHVLDKPEHVLENRKRLRTGLNLPSEPIWLKQVHGVEIIDSRSDSSTASNLVLPQQADGIVTQEIGRVLCVMTADCLPIIFSNVQGTEIAAVHAGWRSMAGGIIERAVATMSTAASDIIAWGGPCIGPDSFEVGQDVLEQLGGSQSAYKASGNAGKHYANLHQLAGERLAALGVHAYSHSDACTYKEPARFFSYRRSMNTSSVDCGRMATLIWLAA